MDPMLIINKPDNLMLAMDLEIKPGMSGEEMEKEKKTDDRWCNVCNKGGHTPETCFVLHPYPKASYQARKNNRMNSKKYATNALDAYDEDTPFHLLPTSSERIKEASANSDQSKVDPILVAAINR